MAYGSYVIQSDNGDVFTFDCGTPIIGRRDAIPFIKNHLGVDTIKRAFVSHYHFNHVGGVVHLCEHFDVKSVHTNGVYSADPRTTYAFNDPKQKDQLDHVLSVKNIPYHFHKAGDTIREKEFYVEVWSPLEHHANHGGYTNDPNGPTNMMIKIVYGGFSLLLTGDLYKPDQLLEVWDTIPDKKITALAWPHHGDFVTARDDVIDPLNVDVVFVERISSASSTVQYLENKNIDYVWLENGRTGIEARKDGSYRKISNVFSDNEYPRMPFS